MQVLFKSNSIHLTNSCTLCSLTEFKSLKNGLDFIHPIQVTYARERAIEAATMEEWCNLVIPSQVNAAMRNECVSIHDGARVPKYEVNQNMACNVSEELSHVGVVPPCLRRRRAIDQSRIHYRIACTV